LVAHRVVSHYADVEYRGHLLLASFRKPIQVV
jgi:hypothetical protein